MLTHPIERCCRDRGSAAVELALITPLLVLTLLLVVALGRLAQTQLRVNDAAHQAARAASLARDPASATARARATAAAALDSGGASCRSMAVNVDTSDFRPGGTVTVTVSCVTALDDVRLLGVPEAKTLNAAFAAPVDAWRGVAGAGPP